MAPVYFFHFIEQYFVHISSFFIDFVMNYFELSCTKPYEKD